MDGKGRVSDSEDVGTANARADAVSVEQGVRDFGKGHSSVDNKTGTRRPTSMEDASPLIYITPKKGYNYSKGGRVAGARHYGSKVIR